VWISTIAKALPIVDFRSECRDHVLDFFKTIIDFWKKNEITIPTVNLGSLFNV